MVEAPTAEECERWCATIAEAAVRELGNPVGGLAEAPE